MLCIFCLVGILLLRKNPWDNKIFYLWYVKCVFVWNEEHMLSTKLLLMGGSSWRVRLSGMEELGSARRLQWGGPSPQWWESCVGMWLTCWGAAHACSSVGLFPSPCTSLGDPRAAYVGKLPNWGLWSSQIPLLLGWLVGTGSLCSALLLQLLDFFTETCTVWPKPAVASGPLQGWPFGGLSSSPHCTQQRELLSALLGHSSFSPFHPSGREVSEYFSWTWLFLFPQLVSGQSGRKCMFHLLQSFLLHFAFNSSVYGCSFHHWGSEGSCILE